VDAVDAPVAAEEDAWVKELLDALLARETPTAATEALVAALKVRSRFVFFSFRSRTRGVSMMKDSIVSGF
jgi:hypothetical protein